MICPKWLVRSSAISAVGAALIAVPIWMASPPQDKHQEPAVEYSSSHFVGQSASENAADKAVRHADTAHQRALQMAPKTQYRGPHCPVRLQLRAPSALQEARDAVDRSRQQAIDGQ